MSPNKRKFYAAAEKGDLQKVKCYMDYNNVDEADRFGRTALFLVISKNYLSISQAHLSVIEFLLEHKADIYKMENRSGNTPLNIAKLSSNNAVLKLFLEKKRMDDSSKYKLIKELVIINNHDAAQAHNVLLKIKCIKGTLAETHHVYSNENLRIEKIKLLIAHLEQVNKKEINDLLSLAIERNNIETAKVFIDLILEKKMGRKKSFVKNNKYLSLYWDEQLKKIDQPYQKQSTAGQGLKRSVGYAEGLDKMFASFYRNTAAITEEDSLLSNSELYQFRQ